MSVKMVFSERLREARENAGKTQVDIAAALGLSSVAVGGWERGKSEPSVANIVRLCRLLGVSADWLLGVDLRSNRNRTADRGVVLSMKSDALQAKAALARITEKLGEMSA